MDAKDIEILETQSGQPFVLGVGSFGTVSFQSRQNSTPTCMCCVLKALTHSSILGPAQTAA